MINTLLACATCAKSFEDHTNAIGWSIFLLLGVIVAVITGVGFFMARLIRRGEADLDPELRDDLPTVSSSR
ncbi:hypothetical protein [Luteolibacter marinus]|uniref:hypothetical protein n=1 Tax=Luteolibacter marinus TaxID=2776705 RepID=UPI00186965CA|nr:hypothetical protein [Luteolibacter marinus]